MIPANDSRPVRTLVNIEAAKAEEARRATTEAMASVARQAFLLIHEYNVRVSTGELTADEAIIALCGFSDALTVVRAAGFKRIDASFYNWPGQEDAELCIHVDATIYAIEKLLERVLSRRVNDFTSISVAYAEALTAHEPATAQEEAGVMVSVVAYIQAVAQNLLDGSLTKHQVEDLLDEKIVGFEVALGAVQRADDVAYSVLVHLLRFRRSALYSEGAGR